MTFKYSLPFHNWMRNETPSMLKVKLDKESLSLQMNICSNFQWRFNVLNCPTFKTSLFSPLQFPLQFSVKLLCHPVKKEMNFWYLTCISKLAGMPIFQAMLHCLLLRQILKRIEQRRKRKNSQTKVTMDIMKVSSKRTKPTEMQQSPRIWFIKFLKKKNSISMLLFCLGLWCEIIP